MIFAVSNPRLPSPWPALCLAWSAYLFVSCAAAAPGGAGGAYSPPVDAGSDTATTAADTSSGSSGARTGTGKYPAKGGTPSTGGGSWTVMLYSMADTNLEAPMMQDIMEMAQVGSSATLNLVVQVDRAEGYSDRALGPIENFTTTKRFRVTKGGLEELADVGELDRTKPDVLADFVGWAIKQYPADHYALILSDHGGGFVGMGPDDSTGKFDLLDMSELRDGLAAGLGAGGVERLDLIGFDACLMSTLEVGLAVRPFAHLMLASEELEPGHGWNYAALEVLAKDPGTSGADLGKALLAGFVGQANENNTESAITLALTDLNKLQPIADAVDALAGAVQGNFATSGLALAKARGAARQFGAQHKDQVGQVDLGQIAAGAAKQDPSLATAGAALVQAINNAVLAKHVGPALSGATGLTIYFPGSANLYKVEYGNLDFMAGWRSMLGGLFGWAKGNQATTKPVLTPADPPIIDSGDSLAIVGTLAPGTGKYIGEANLLVGELDSASTSVMAFMVLPGQVKDDKVVAGWPKSVAVLTQGTEQVPGFVQLQITDGYVVADFPIVYTAPGLAATGGLMRFVYDANTSALVDQPILFVESDGVVGAITAAAGSTVEPMVLVLDSAGAQTWKPVGKALAGDSAMGANLVPYGSGNVYMALIVSDLAGQSAMIGGAWALTAP